MAHELIGALLETHTEVGGLGGKCLHAGHLMRRVEYSLLHDVPHALQHILYARIDSGGISVIDLLQHVQREL